MIYLILIGLGAGFVQRVSGFGLGIFAMLFLPYFMPTHTAAAAVASLFSCVTSIYNAVCYHKHIKFRVCLPMICAALISIPIAVHFSSDIPGEVFKIILGVILIALSIYFLFFNKNFKIRPTVLNGVSAGGLGGVLGGLFSTGGPPAVLYLSAATDDKLTYFATIQFYFSFTNIYATSLRAVEGDLTTQVLIYAAVGIAGCLAGDFIGRFAFNKLDGDKFKKIIYVGMIISGLLMIL